MVLFFGSVGPDDFRRNYASWATTFGLRKSADWLAEYATGPAVLSTILLFCSLYVFTVWVLPALIHRLKRRTASVVIPLLVAFVFLVTLYAGRALQPPSWSMTDKQDHDLRTALNSAPIKFNVRLGVVPAAPSDAMATGYHLMNMFLNSPGWGAILFLVDAEYLPSQTGVTIAVKAHTNPEQNEKARVLKLIFDQAGLSPVYGGDNQLPDGEAKIVIGVRP